MILEISRTDEANLQVQLSSIIFDQESGRANSIFVIDLEGERNEDGLKPTLHFSLSELQQCLSYNEYIKLTKALDQF